MSQADASIYEDVHAASTRGIEASDALNPNWEWSDSFTSFIADHIEGRSAKICTGLRPIADLNIDILPLPAVVENCDAASYTIDERTNRISPDSNGHHALGGRFIQADAFDLPFPDRSFQTVISDPPWRAKSKQERKRLFEECLRICDVGGKIIYNATWLPDHEKIRRRDTRMRQQAGFWGNPSFVELCRRTPDRCDLATHYDYTVDGHVQKVVMSRGVDLGLITNPHAVDPTVQDHNCPKCGCTQLRQLSEAENPHNVYTCDLYECCDCQFRIFESELASPDPPPIPNE